MNEARDGNRPSAQERQLGVIVKMPAAASVELAGHAGFDYVMIDTEHGAADMIELEHHVRAAETAGIRPLVRVSDARSPDILRALDAGACGIIAPHALSELDVRQAVSLTRYPPTGRRGLALSTRAGAYGTRSAAEHVQAAEELLLIVQIEDAEALERLPEILDAEGLDGIFIGPSDLSASLGVRGQTDHPAVEAAIERVVEAVVQRPSLRLCVLASDEHEALRWFDRGAHLVLINIPTLLSARLRDIRGAVAQASLSEARS
jgi:4-hydroxy-2-oxoheptanedioate aldolase